MISQLLLSSLSVVVPFQDEKPPEETGICQPTGEQVVTVTEGPQQADCYWIWGDYDCGDGVIIFKVTEVCNYWVDVTTKTVVKGEDSVTGKPCIVSVDTDTDTILAGGWSMEYGEVCPPDTGPLFCLPVENEWEEVVVDSYSTPHTIATQSIICPNGEKGTRRLVETRHYDVFQMFNTIRYEAIWPAYPEDCPPDTWLGEPFSVFAGSDTSWVIDCPDEEEEEELHQDGATPISTSALDSRRTAPSFRSDSIRIPAAPSYWAQKQRELPLPMDLVNRISVI